MMKNFFWIFILIAAGLSSCNEEVAQSIGPKPAAMGVLNDIVVIAENDDWEGIVGDTCRYYFASAYPILPQPEPFFDIRHFSGAEINAEPLRRNLRTYVVLGDLSDVESLTTQMIKKDLGEDRFNKALRDGKLVTSVGRDKWARGQIIVYILGRNQDELVANIRNNFSAVAKRIHVHDTEQLKAKVYVKNINKGITKKLAAELGINMNVPGDYRAVPEDSDFTWIRRDLVDVVQNIAFKKIPYSNQEQISVANVKALTNEFGKLVETNVPGSFMQVNDTDLPMYDYQRDIGDNYALEVRGIWEINNDFVGGSFASYMIHDKGKNELVFVVSFVFAPGNDKRDFMQELEYLVKSITFEK